MRRDMEYCINLLKDFSKGEFEKIFYERGPFTEKPEEVFLASEKYLYHLKILEDAGFIEYKLDQFNEGMFLANCPIILWDGNDFLDMIENDNLWNKTKEAAKNKGFEIAKMPIDLVVSFAKMKAKEILGMEIPIK